MVPPMAAMILGTALVVPFSFYAPGDRTKVLVKGEERIEVQGSSVEKKTNYTDSEGKLAATEECRYDAATLALEHYHFEDLKTGELADIRVKNGKAKTQYRSPGDKKIDESEIDWTNSDVSGKALPEIILKNWASIAKGGQVDVDLYVPFRMSTIGFRAVRHGEALVKDTVTVRLEPTNWVIRQFAPTIYFSFVEGEPLPKLVHYKGPSMVDIDGKKNMTVEIDFR